MIALVAALMVFAASCGGGDKPRPIGEGQADYLEQVLASWCGLSDRTPEASELAARLAQQVDRIAQLSPPAELAGEHSRYVSAARKAAGALEALKTGQTVDPDSDSGRAIRAAVEADQTFQQALSDHYAVKLFRMEGASMEPALSNNDTVAIRRLEEPLRRWEIIVFQFPLDPSRDFLKRVVGLPGETIEVRDSKIYVDGAVVEDDTYAKDGPNYTYAAKTVPVSMYYVLGDNRRNSFDSHAWGNSCSPQQLCDFVPENLILGVLPADTKGCRSRANS